MEISCLSVRPLTGVGYYTLNLLHAFVQQAPEYQIRLLASSARKPVAPPELTDTLAARFRGVRCPTRIKTWLWTRAEWPPIEWFTGPVDIAHGAFCLLPAARRAARVATIFDITDVRFPETRRRRIARMHAGMIRHTLRRADAVITISQNARSEIIEYLGARPELVHVVPGGCHLEELSGPFDTGQLGLLKKRLGIRGDYLVHLGTIEPRKNLARLVRAYAQVRARLQDCPVLVLAGMRGRLSEDVFGAIARCNLEKSVVCTGYLSRPDAVTLLRGAHACVYPSFYEGFGLPVLEAMAARVPVLTSNVSSMPEVIGGHGILIEPEHEESIASGLIRLLEDREAALARAALAAERAKQFTWQASARALGAVYRGLLERGRP